MRPGRLQARPREQLIAVRVDEQITDGTGRAGQTGDQHGGGSTFPQPARGESCVVEIAHDDAGQTTGLVRVRCDQRRQRDQSLEQAVDELETQMIRRALDEADFNQTKAAETLGTTRRILKYKMDKLGIGETKGENS